jgi:hypothetical protein
MINEKVPKECFNLCGSNLKNIEYENIIQNLQTNGSTPEIIEMMKIFSYACISKVIADSVINTVSWGGKMIHLKINLWFKFMEWIFFIVCLCIVCVIVYIIYLGDGWRSYPSTYNTTCNVSGLAIENPLKCGRGICPFDWSGNKQKQKVGIIFHEKMDLDKELNKFSDSFLKENVSTKNPKEDSREVDVNDYSEKKETNIEKESK